MLAEHALHTHINEGGDLKMRPVAANDIKAKVEAEIRKPVSAPMPAMDHSQHKH